MKEQSLESYVAGSGDFESLVASWNASSGVAVSIGAFTGGKRAEPNCSAISGFGIDIDTGTDAFAKLSTGGSNPESAIPGILTRLAARGIVPHAMVRSGHGLHVYVLIDRVRLLDDAERTRVKQVWYRLCQALEGATDRYDLASVLRVPGTKNRKNGGEALASFIEEHTALGRPRYSLEYLEGALADLPELPPDKRVGSEKVRAPRKASKAVTGSSTTLPEADAYELGILDLAVAWSPALVKARNASRRGDGDRSKADFTYAVRLVEAGFSEAVVAREIGLSAKASTKGEAYVHSTVQAALSEVVSPVFPVFSAGFQSSHRAEETVYRTFRRPLPPDLLELVTPPPGPVGEAEPPPSVVMARPGDGKTRNTVLTLAMGYGLHNRLVFSGLFAAELLRHEHFINCSFRDGLPYLDGDDRLVEPDHGLPRTHDDAWGRLPAEVRQNWPLEKFRAEVPEPDAFFINAMHPHHVDRRLEPDIDDDGQVVRPPWIQDDDDLFRATAVAKFSGMAKFCLAAKSDAELSGPSAPCGRHCPYKACRANATPGGSKTRWREAPIGLMTHQSFRAQQFFTRGEGEDFEAVIFDEVPDFVYRAPTIRIEPVGKTGAKQNWRVYPLDELHEVYSAMRSSLEFQATKEGARELQSGRLDEILTRLWASRTALAKQAGNLQKSAPVNGERRRKAETREPFICSADFEHLLSLAPRDKTVVAGGKTHNLAGLLMLLADFCGGEEFDCYVEEAFGTKNPAMRLTRPVNGWPELLNRADGERRRLLVLDATAGIDPKYLLAGHAEWEAVPSCAFPETTVVLTEEKKGATRSKTKVHGESADALVTRIERDVAPLMSEVTRARLLGADAPRLLILTDVETERRIASKVEAAARAGTLPARVEIAHFGNLRGRNNFRDFNAVYLTHLHRYDESHYIGMALLNRRFKDAPRQYANKGKGKKHANSKADRVWKVGDAHIARRSMTCDLYQDLMRIGLRDEPSRPAVLFVPTTEAEYLVRLLRLFRGASIQHGDMTIRPAVALPAA